MNERDIVQRRIKEILKEIAPSINTDLIADDTGLISKGLLDSMGFLTLAVHVQQEFSIEIPFENYEPEEFTVFGIFVTICMNAIADKKA
jgi:acyl carrier protein